MDGFLYIAKTILSVAYDYLLKGLERLKKQYIVTTLPNQILLGASTMYTKE